MKIAILGGTGAEGKGLALRWAGAGHQVFLGSRDASKGERVAGELNQALTSEHIPIEGADNAEAARQAEVVVSTLPHEGHSSLLRRLAPHLSDKMFITATIAWPPGNLDKPSAAEEAQKALDGVTEVVAAFQTISSGSLALDATPEEPNEDVLVFGEKASRDQAAPLIEQTGFRAVQVGTLKHTRKAEALTGLLLRINKVNGVKSTGVRVTGLESKR